MIFAEWFNKNKAVVTAQEMDQLTYKQALLIGLYQCISVLWPGFSRSGSTIAGGMLSGASYKAAADFLVLYCDPNHVCSVRLRNAGFIPLFNI